MKGSNTYENKTNENQCKGSLSGSFGFGRPALASRWDSEQPRGIQRRARYGLSMHRCHHSGHLRDPDAGDGTRFPTVGGTQTLIGVVRRTYDGMGNFTQIDNIHGSVTGWVPNRPGSGTYQVNPDCTAATQFVPGPGAPVIEERLVIVDGGSELYSATVSPLPLMVTTVSKRIDPR